MLTASAILAGIAILAVFVLGFWDLDDELQLTGSIKAWYVDGRDRGKHAWRGACWKPTCQCDSEHKLSPALVIERVQRERKTLEHQRAADRKLRAEVDSLALAGR